MYFFIERSVSFIIDAVCKIHDIPPNDTYPTDKIIFEDEASLEFMSWDIPFVFSIMPTKKYLI